MAQVTEIAPDFYRITTFVEPFNLQFSQFLVRDEEPLLFHTGPRMLFPAVREAVASLIDLTTLRWIGFSHFETDECGTLPEWQQLAPHATAVCSLVGKLVSWMIVLYTSGRRYDRWRDSLNRSLSVSFSLHAPCSSLLGSRTPVRRNTTDLVMLGPLSSDWRRRARDRVRYFGTLPPGLERIPAGAFCELYSLRHADGAHFASIG